MKKYLIIGIACVLVVYVFIYKKGAPEEKVVKEVVQNRQCFSRKVLATQQAPYAVEEYVSFIIEDQTVSGKKIGFQRGPEMTNGYEGELSGSINDDVVNVLFSYTIEGSSQLEQEEYQLGDSLTKKRYPLVEQGNVLVSDKTQEYVVQKYEPFSCDLFDEKTT